MIGLGMLGRQALHHAPHPALFLTHASEDLPRQPDTWKWKTRVVAYRLRHNQI